MQMMGASVMGASERGGEFKRGTKRNASDSRLSDFERFEKRLRMLSIQNEEKANRISAVRGDQHAQSADSSPTQAQPPPSERMDDSMHVDDTPNRIYISDLDAELAGDDEEAEGERLIFLPDIEKHFSRIPQQVLTGRHENDGDNLELVLYSVPKSLTVDEEQDSVRKAIVEARHRAREQALQNARSAAASQRTRHELGQQLSISPGPGEGHSEADYDPDAMDIG